MRFIKRKANGYFTIEACVLVAVAFFLFALIIHLTFYMHARTILIQDTYLLAFRASLEEEDKDASQLIGNMASMQFGSRYFGNDVPVVEASDHQKKITADAYTVTHRSAYDLALPEIWQVRAVAETIRYDMPAHIRRVARVADLIRAHIR